jgi:hypothetical protein
MPGRKTKNGLDYFPMDVHFLNDRKIKRLLRSDITDVLGIYIALLSYIYQDEGYFYAWDDDSLFDISDDLKTDETHVQSVLDLCLEIGLFNVQIFNNYSILTSKSIQQRWYEIVTKAKRKQTKIDESIDLISEEIPINSELIPKNSEEIDDSSELNTQSKEKESKEKESKEKESKELSNPSESDTCYSFDDFWNDYDKKEKRALAEKKYSKISEKDRALIQSFLAIYIKAKPDREYRPLPTTFLIQQIWKDDWNEYTKLIEQQNNQPNGNKPTRNSGFSKYEDSSSFLEGLSTMRQSPN